MIFHLRMKILLLSFLLSKTSETSTFSQVLATVLKYYNVVFCIFKCIFILLMRNIKIVIIKLFLQFIYSNKDFCKKSRKSFYLLGGETANHDNFMQHMLTSHSSCYF